VILTYPLDAIGQFLEQHGLDPLEEEPDTTATLSEESDEEHTPVLQINAAIVTSRRLPNSDTNIPSQESDIGASASSNILRESIPELAQSLASVRTMASRPSMAPTLIITSSHTGINSAYLTSTTGMSETRVSHSTPRSEGFSPGIEANVAEQSATSPAESGPRFASSAFDLSDLTSSLPNRVGVETNSRNSRSSLGFHSSTSRSDQGPHTLRREPDPESTVYGLHRQHVGLLGETFVRGITCALSTCFKSLTDSYRSMNGFRFNYTMTGMLLATGRVEIVTMSSPSSFSKVVRRIMPTSRIQTMMETSPVY
jgi:hypothetical protein